MLEALFGGSRVSRPHFNSIFFDLCKVSVGVDNSMCSFIPKMWLFIEKSAVLTAFGSLFHKWRDQEMEKCLDL